tara:strand:- start:7325 stop:7576 length:252 start_codon:yes stop_codon:yes gene_type:complete
MIDNNTIKTKINNFLIEEFEIDPSLINENSNLVDDLGLDSLDFVDVVVEIEDIFGVKLTGEDFINVTTLEDFHNLIINKVNNS